MWHSNILKSCNGLGAGVPVSSIGLQFANPILFVMHPASLGQCRYAQETSILILLTYKQVYIGSSFELKLVKCDF
jgi:hypothetical protein